jgi:hypothetical protein
VSAPEQPEQLLARYERRTRELEALYETAGDLSALRDVDRVLGAIVRRGRQLLGSDVAYLMLLDEERQQAYMRVTEGTLTGEFLSIRLAFGEGLGGLVAKTGTPQWTGDYAHDTRFAPAIDQIVRGESLHAILGVPLKVGDRVTGVLFASHRSERAYSHGEVALLSSLASHAAIALENASLFEEAQRAVRELRAANARIEEHNRVLERAADLHERLTELVLTGAGIDALADAVADVIGGIVVVLDPEGRPLTGTAEVRVPEHVGTGQVAGDAGSVELPDEDGRTVRVAPARAGDRRLGALVHVGDEALEATDVRSLERAALVTALLLLDRRAYDEARVRVMGELLARLTGGGLTGAGVAVDAGWLRERARVADVVVPEPPYVVLAALDPRGPDGLHELGRVVAEVALGEHGLARVDEGHVAVLLRAADDAATLARNLAERLTAALGAPVTVGAVGPVDTPGEVAGALGRAMTCARVLERIGRGGEGATPEQLGVYTLLLSEAGRDQIDGFIDETVGEVLRWDEDRKAQLAESLLTYFDHGGQVGAAAEALYIHVNTLYQRLERVDRLLGAHWRRGDDSLQVHLALRLARLRHAM